MSKITPEILTHKVIGLCSDCELCRENMADAPCQFLPFLFTLGDNKKAGQEISPQKLQHLIELCNTCGQCPCKHVQANIRKAKDAYVERDGLPLTIRLIEDVRLMGRLGGIFPRLANWLLQKEPTAGLMKRFFGIHPDRKFPTFPTESFGSWAKARGICQMRESIGRKVAYFTGCSARYLFPEVAKSTVEILEHNGVNVYLPEQRCCGMPPMLEGDRGFTFDVVDFNMPELTRCIESGYDIVTSCPTCAYMFKTVIRAGAHFAEDYVQHVRQLFADMGGDLFKVQKRLEEEQLAFTGRVNQSSSYDRERWLSELLCSAHRFHDEGYFSSITGRDRLMIASHTYELGEYLLEMRQAGELRTDFGPLSNRMAYFPPCHLREMNIGTPWAQVLGQVPGLNMKTVGDMYDCCGLGGVMGFKKQFHKVSLAMGRPLVEKIRAVEPDCVVTDCLSCRLQFNHMLPYDVAHPVEVLRDAYRAGPSWMSAAPREMVSETV